MFKVTNYDPEDSNKAWRGQSNQSLTLGDEVTDGTYFYVLDLKDGKKNRSGYIMLNRLK